MAEATSQEILERLKQVILDMISDIKDNILTLPSEQDDIILVEFFFGRLHPETVSHHVLKKVVPHKEHIKARSEDFFRKNKFIFSGLKEDKVNYYEKVLSNPNRVNAEDKKIMWEYFDEIIRLSEEYKKQK